MRQKPGSTGFSGGRRSRKTVENGAKTDQGRPLSWRGSANKSSDMRELPLGKRKLSEPGVYGDARRAPITGNGRENQRGDSRGDSRAIAQDEVWPPALIHRLASASGRRRDRLICRREA